jgi:hypothetical protein
MKSAAVESSSEVLVGNEISRVTQEIIDATPVVDIHTHLFPSRFGVLASWGIDDLLTYHYLEAEFFRFSSIRPSEYFERSQPRRADLIWKTLFIENAPISEAARGVVAVLQALGLDSTTPDLECFRDYFRDQTLDRQIERVFDLAGVQAAVMTNDPLDPREIPYWSEARGSDRRFRPALRLDRILNLWPEHFSSVAAQGYSVDERLSGNSIAEVRRFLYDWSAQMQPVYMAVSLPDTFAHPATDVRGMLLTQAVLPVARELELPLALMIGVRRQVNPALRLAGDASGRADLTALERLCLEFPDNRFLVSVLSRENQHELCVTARKFSNLMPFGCWWFLNNGSVVDEITRERLEMLGASFIAQHSDARVLEQLIYKWRNARRTIGPPVAAQFERLAEDGRLVTRRDIESVVARLFRTNAEDWMGAHPPVRAATKQ